MEKKSSSGANFVILILIVAIVYILAITFFDIQIVPKQLDYDDINIKEQVCNMVQKVIQTMQEYNPVIYD